ncbi:MAG: S8 family serine peptidase, partial [Candidatus Nitrosocosmicus sp.]|nr:S8 family serine peptidase [Candidatus Nitrosocosmicus sp.]
MSSSIILLQPAYGSIENQSAVDPYGRDSYQQDNEDIVPGSFTVMLKEPLKNEIPEGKNSSEILRERTISLANEIEEPGINVVQIYENLGGFAINTQGNYTMTNSIDHPAQPASNSPIDQKIFQTITKLRNDPMVLAVEPDVFYTIQRLTGVSVPTDPMSTGYDRIDAEFSSRPPIVCPPGANVCSGANDMDIAIIDTGVDNHIDLNLELSRGFTPGIPPVGTISLPSFYDNTGLAGCNNHGTHVAGIAAAKNNGIGVIGTAADARIHSLNPFIINATGHCVAPQKNILEALEYIYETIVTSPGFIDVVNMSLGGLCIIGGCKNFEASINRIVSLGVPVVVAAGNEGIDVINAVPARFEKAITVSNMVDFDGKCGGKVTKTLPGGTISTTLDDFLSPSSNFGSLVDIAAPGTLITSTVMDGGGNSIYEAKSGTSMAAPFVAGAVAVYKYYNPYATSEEIIKHLKDRGTKPVHECDGHGRGYFTRDSDGFNEPLLYMGLEQSSRIYAIPGWFGAEDQGGGIAVADINGNGQLDLVAFHIDNPGGENHGYYRIGYDLSTSGSVSKWSSPTIIPGWFGAEDQGGGIAVAD